MSFERQSTNKTLNKERDIQLGRQTDMFQKATQDTPELTRWREQSGNWDKWLKGGDYSKGPEGSMLNFDLWNPAHTQQQVAKMSNLEGVGAASMAGPGDSSIAVSQAKERNANEAAQNAGQAYEQAVGQQDAYFKNANPMYMNAENAKALNLFSTQSNNAQDAGGNWLRHRTQNPSPWEGQFQKAVNFGLGKLGIT